MVIYFSTVAITIKRHMPIEKFRVRTIRPIVTEEDKKLIAEYLMKPFFSYTDMEKIEVYQVDRYMTEDKRFPIHFVDKVIIF